MSPVGPLNMGGFVTKTPFSGPDFVQLHWYPLLKCTHEHHVHFFFRFHIVHFCWSAQEMDQNNYCIFTECVLCFLFVGLNGLWRNAGPGFIMLWRSRCHGLTDDNILAAPCLPWKGCACIVVTRTRWTCCLKTITSPVKECCTTTCCGTTSLWRPHIRWKMWHWLGHLSFFSQWCFIVHWIAHAVSSSIDLPTKCSSRWVPPPLPLAGLFIFLSGFPFLILLVRFSVAPQTDVFFHMCAPRHRRASIPSVLFMSFIMVMQERVF